MEHVHGGAPPLWELEWGVVEVAVQELALRREQVTPGDRLLEDLNIDSLEIVELIMAVEERFGVSIPDDAARAPFVESPMRLRDLARFVQHQWGTGRPERRDWRDAPASVQPAGEVPFTQMGGSLAAREWQEGNLFEPMPPNREGFPQYRRRTDGMRCVLVPAGEAVLGSDAEDALDDQRPLHRAALDAFLIDAEPVSNAACARFLNAIGPVPEVVLSEWCGVEAEDRRGAQFQLSRSKRGWEPVRGTERHPVVLVSWFGANAYALWANRRDWRRYRADGDVPEELADIPVDAPAAPEYVLGALLPSEAQWEYAARGADGRRYPWGDELPDAALMQVAQHSAGRTYGAESLPSAPVNARLGLSPFGLHHMAGNVWQWCRDWYDPAFYGSESSSAPNPQNATPTGIRSERGGSWVGPEELALSAYRRGRRLHLRGRCLGFRCISLIEDLPAASA